MAERELPPSFTYYRDPLKDGSVERSDDTCSACGRRRGFICSCTAHGLELPEDVRFCPWCVADGRAHTRFGVSFNLVSADAPRKAREEVEYRTPGFVSWQDWGWPTHCDDVAVYIGQPGGDELRASPEAYEALLQELRRDCDWTEDEDYLTSFINGLGASAVAYLFECRRCHKPIVCWDAE